MLGATSNIALIVYPSSFYETRCRLYRPLTNTLQAVIVDVRRAINPLGKAGERRRRGMARILTTAPERTRGLRKLLIWVNKRQYGGEVPGIATVLLPDLNVAFPTVWLYNYLHMRKSSPLTRLQREMLATVVNGLIGGAP